MEIYSWGANSHGQLGQGNFEDSWIPLKLDDTEIQQLYGSRVSGGGGHTAVIAGGDKLYMCGLNDQGQLGDCFSQVKRQPVPRLLSTLTVQNLACGWDFTLAITSGGQLWSWGSNSFGQTGQNIMCKRILQPAVVEDLKEVQFSEVSAGLRHAAAIASSGDVWTWGDTRRGQVPLSCHGNSELSLGRVSRPVKMSFSPKEAKQVHCGAFFTLLLTGMGEVFGWGDNSRGQLACKPSDITKRTCPIIILDVPRCWSLAAGWSHVISISDQGQVFSWGRGDYGQLGRSCPPSGWDHRPDVVVLPGPATQVCCGSEHSLAVTEDKCLFVWGWNEHGMCAMSESVASVLLPHLVTFKSKARIISVGAGAGHSFACLVPS